MTDDILVQARAALDGTTEGPWYAESAPVEPYGLQTVYNTFNNGETQDMDLVAEVAYDNALFIAWSREGVPALIAEIERMRRDRREETAAFKSVAELLIIELDRRRAQVQRVRELHENRGCGNEPCPNTAPCGYSECSCGRPWPCPTIQALDGEV